MDQYQQETPDLPRPVQESLSVKDLQQRLAYLEQRLERQQNDIDRLRRQLHQLDANHRITQHRVFRDE
jgi:predicted RNase H-like nuclease (RuvC/YqgF family)